MLRLSIITTLYKSSGYMDKCLSTLLDQDLGPDEYEIILVNDGSPDDSLAKAKAYESAHPNVRVVSYEANRGLAGARQAGTDEARGEFLCYVDPDDYIEKRSFAKVLKQMQDEQLDMLRFDYRMVDEGGSTLTKPSDARLIDYSPKVMDGPSFLTQRLGYGCFVWAYIYRTSLIRESGVRFRQGDYFDDTAWLPRIIRKTERINSSPAVRYFYYQRSDSLVNTVSQDAIIRKLDAEMVVVDRLCEQMPDAAKDGTEGWYRAMNSKLALAVLSTSAVQALDKYDEYLLRLREKRVFPLSCPKASRAQKAKLLLLNLAPGAFRRLIRYKNR